MRVLTVRQPAAWAIMWGGKTVENRGRNIAGDYRGPVAIQAGLQVLNEDHPFWDHNQYRAAFSHATAHVRHRVDVRGAILGVVDLVDVHHCFNARTNFEGCSPWAEPDAWHLVFANPRALDKPVPWRGALGLVGAPLGIEGEWLVEYGDACSCGVGGLSYGHERGCGVEPLARLGATA